MTEEHQPRCREVRSVGARYVGRPRAHRHDLGRAVLGSDPVGLESATERCIGELDPAVDGADAVPVERVVHAGQHAGPEPLWHEVDAPVQHLSGPPDATAHQALRRREAVEAHPDVDLGEAHRRDGIEDVGERRAVRSVHHPDAALGADHLFETVLVRRLADEWMRQHVHLLARPARRGTDRVLGTALRPRRSSRSGTSNPKPVPRHAVHQCCASDQGHLVNMATHPPCGGHSVHRCTTDKLCG